MTLNITLHSLFCVCSLIYILILHTFFLNILQVFQELKDHLQFTDYPITTVKYHHGLLQLWLDRSCIIKTTLMKALMVTEGIKLYLNATPGMSLQTPGSKATGSSSSSPAEEKTEVLGFYYGSNNILQSQVI